MTAAEEQEATERFRKLYIGEFPRGAREALVWDAAERVRKGGRNNVASIIHATLDAVEAAGVHLSPPAPDLLVREIATELHDHLCGCDEDDFTGCDYDPNALAQDVAQRLTKRGFHLTTATDTDGAS